MIKATTRKTMECTQETFYEHVCLLIICTNAEINYVFTNIPTVFLNLSLQVLQQLQLLDALSICKAASIFDAVTIYKIPLLAVLCYTLFFRRRLSLNANIFLTQARLSWLNSFFFDLFLTLVWTIFRFL